MSLAPDLALEPLMTLGVPTYNSSKFLDLFLQHVYSLNYAKKNLRLVFVDNLSKDYTVQMLQAFQRRHSSEYESIRLETNPEPGLIPRSHNTIVRNAVGKYVMILDHDVLVSPDTLHRLLRVAGDQDASIVQSLYLADVDRTTFRRPLRARLVVVETCDTGCTIFDRKVFEKVGLFNESFRWPASDDIDFTGRASRAGFKILIDQREVLPHLNPTGRYRAKFDDEGRVKPVFIRTRSDRLEVMALDSLNVRDKFRLMRTVWVRHDRVRIFTYLALLVLSPVLLVASKLLRAIE